MSSFKLAVFSLNQWALDFEGNTRRINKSLDLAYEAGAFYRAGPELEVCGYSVEDGFFERDTVFHSWSSALRILEHSKKMDMIIDIGMPVQLCSLYNCRVIAYHGKILCIRAKTSLAKEGNYREYRHFAAWDDEAGIVAYKLPKFVSSKLAQQEFVPFGSNYVLEVQNGRNGCDSLRIGWEICQELWDSKNTSSKLYQDFGCHLVINSSGSYWELRKLETVLDMIKGVSLRGGGCYAYSNLVGCDGQRYVFYGRSCIYDKGNLVGMTPTCSKIYNEIQMVTHTINPNELDSYRAQMGIQARYSMNAGSVWNLSDPNLDVTDIDSSYNRLLFIDKLRLSNKNSRPCPVDPPLRFEQEIHLYVSLWLWDYLRRSGMRGFMVPLSGGLDSSSVAMLVYSMSNNLMSNRFLAEVRDYFSKVHKKDSTLFTSAKEICRLLLKCSYLSTNYSSSETRERAEELANSIGAEFVELSLQDTYTGMRELLNPDSSSDQVSLLDQNLQARLRMTATYYLSGGDRIVLATGNVDEGIMGYLTKYDCSSADINPIGGLCKKDLKSYLRYCSTLVYANEPESMVEILNAIHDAPPSAELTGSEQRDEVEIGITYDEISVLGKVRRGIYGCCGPLEAFETVWRQRDVEPFCEVIRCLRPGAPGLGSKAAGLADLIKRFYTRYSRNRHKLTVLTPALHAETYSPDDNRFDHRHFLYAPWSEQFASIDRLVETMMDEKEESASV